jgi:hypothetical protein
LRASARRDATSEEPPRRGTGEGPRTLDARGDDEVRALRARGRASGHREAREGAGGLSARVVDSGREGRPRRGRRTRRAVPPPALRVTGRPPRRPPDPPEATYLVGSTRPVLAGRRSGAPGPHRPLPTRRIRRRPRPPVGRSALPVNRWTPARR